jgi:hypothetical protein
VKWNEDKGWGFLAPNGECEKNYWTEYRELDKTPLGRVLTALRAGMVYKHTDPTSGCLDVGIGGGAFVLETGFQGADTNPEAKFWLEAGCRLWAGGPSPVMTFWDSIEHIENPGLYLAKATGWVFLSTPIYEDEAGAISSKHYKPNEHLWYFTDHGIKMFMREYGFSCHDENRLEDDAGREGIGSYAFKRD